MRKYEVYLPLKYNDAQDIEAEKIRGIKEELVDTFGAITVSSLISPLSRKMEIRWCGIH